MRKLLAVIGVAAALHFTGLPTLVASPVLKSADVPAPSAFRRDGLVLAGMGGETRPQGGMNCEANCGDAGMETGAGKPSPYSSVPHPNCPDHRRTGQNPQKQEYASTQRPDSRRRPRFQLAAREGRIGPGVVYALEPSGAPAGGLETAGVACDDPSWGGEAPRWRGLDAALIR